MSVIARNLSHLARPNRAPVVSALACASALVGMACGGPGANELVSPRKLAEASNRPTITGIVDLGAIDPLPTTGALPTPDSDGRFTPGELVLVQGKDFGKQPSIQISGRSTRILARTGAGGIVARVPAGAITGTTRVQVSTARGDSNLAMTVERYAVALQRSRGDSAGLLFALALLSANGADARDLESRATLEIAGARDVAFSPDGRVALVAARAAGEHAQARLVVVAMTAARAPRVVHELRLTGAEAEHIAVATRGTLAAVATARQVMLVDIEDPLRPAAYRPFSPLAAAQSADDETIVALALSPDGAMLAVLTSQGNRVIPVDLGAPNAPKNRTPLVLLADERMPLVKDMGFTSAGDQLYVVAGDNREALAAGEHATRIIEVDTSGAAWQVTRSAEIGGAGAGAPMALAVSPADGGAGATSTEAGDAHAALVVSTVARGFLGAGAADADTTGDTAADTIADTAADTAPSQLVNAVLAGRSQELAAHPDALTDVVFGPRGAFVLAAAARATKDAGRELGVLLIRESADSPRFVRLGAAAGKLADVRLAVQP